MTQIWRLFLRLFRSISEGSRDGHERETNSSANQDHGLTAIPGLASTYHDIADRPVPRSADQMKVQDEEMENLMAVIAQNYGTTVATVRAEARAGYRATLAEKYDLSWSLAGRLTNYIKAS